jgi:hypothetical protein
MSRIVSIALQIFRKSEMFMLTLFLNAYDPLHRDLYRLEEVGYGVGQRMVELVGCRERLTRRETRLVNMLQVLHQRPS